MPILSQPDHELINKMESNISLVWLKSKDDANVPKEQAAQTKGDLSDSEPMREANTSLQEFWTMCKEFLKVLSTASIFKNTDCAQKSKASESYKEQPDTSVKVKESNLKSSRRVTRALARSSHLPLLAMNNTLLWNFRGIGNIKSRRRVAKLVKMYNKSLIAILEPLHHANKIQEFSNWFQMTRLFSTAKTIIGGCRLLETTSSFGCWISCKLGCGCIGCKRNVGALGVCWPCTLASCNVVCMIEVVWWLTSMLMVIPKVQRMNEAMIVPG